ncbi:MAG: O-antigen ligase family protein, partial [Solirubrobacterales bacterium]|nr:O-antigen ligase family protein [Solirubrobacterales bacterium]
LLVFAELRLTALWLWAPLAVLTYPFMGATTTNVNFGRIWIIGMFALLLILPRARASARASSWMLVALALLAAVVAVRTATTPGTKGDYAYGFRVWADSLLLPLILFAVVRRVVAVRAAAAEWVALTLVVAGLLLAVAGLAEELLGVHLNQVRFDPAIGTVRLAGPYDAPEPYGLALVLCLAGTLFWLQIRRRARDVHFAVIAIVVLELAAIFFTFFRVAWLGAFVVVVTSLGLRPKHFSRMLGVLAIAALVVGLSYTQLEKTSVVSNRVGNTQNVFARVGAWEQGIEIFKQNPAFGVGVNQYTVVASSLPYLNVSGTNSVPYPHSSFVLMLAEDGAVGLGALLLACGAVVALLRSLRRRTRSAADGALLGTLVGAAVAYLAFSLTLAMLPFGPSNQFFAVLLGLGAGTLDRLSAPRRRRAGALVPRVGGGLPAGVAA